MYAVFAFENPQGLKLPAEDTIYLFDTEEEAAKWQAELLVESGYAEKSEDGYRLKGPMTERIFRSAEGVVEEWQDGCGMLEFFHCYPAKDMRSEKIAS